MELPIKIKIKKSYKLLYQDDRIEIRKYPPCRRVVSIWRDNLWGVREQIALPMPYQVYVGVSYRSLPNVRHFSFAFGSRSNKCVYASPFGAVGQAICLDMEWHGSVPASADLAEAAARFWSTDFYIPQDYRLKQMIGVSNYQEWSKLTTDEVLKQLHYGRHSVEDLVKQLRAMYNR